MVPSVSTGIYSCAILRLHEFQCRAKFAGSPDSRLCPVASTPVSFQQSSPIGPVMYTVTKATVIQLQALYATNGTVTSPIVSSDINGATSITAIRIY